MLNNLLKLLLNTKLTFIFRKKKVKSVHVTLILTRKNQREKEVYPKQWIYMWITSRLGRGDIISITRSIRKHGCFLG
jgi:hypothetical protein